MLVISENTNYLPLQSVVDVFVLGTDQVVGQIRKVSTGWIPSVDGMEINIIGQKCNYSSIMHIMSTVQDALDRIQYHLDGGLVIDIEDEICAPQV